MPDRRITGRLFHKDKQTYTGDSANAHFLGWGKYTAGGWRSDFERTGRSVLNQCSLSIRMCSGTTPRIRREADTAKRKSNRVRKDANPARARRNLWSTWSRAPIEQIGRAARLCKRSSCGKLLLPKPHQDSNPYSSDASIQVRYKSRSIVPDSRRQRRDSRPSLQDTFLVTALIWSVHERRSSRCRPKWRWTCRCGTSSPAA